jgi:hypothetical protein
MPQRHFAALGLAALAFGCASEPYEPFASHRAFRSHCRAALDVMAARDPDRARFSVEQTNAVPRGDQIAVTIIYLQGESRRLFTCLYAPDQPGRMAGGSYRGQPLTPPQLDEINARAARR